MYIRLSTCLHVHPLYTHLKIKVKALPLMARFKVWSLRTQCNYGMSKTDVTTLCQIYHTVRSPFIGTCYLALMGSWKKCQCHSSLITTGKTYLWPSWPIGNEKAILGWPNSGNVEVSPDSHRSLVPIDFFRGPVAASRLGRTVRARVRVCWAPGSDTGLKAWDAEHDRIHFSSCHARTPTYAACICARGGGLLGLLNLVWGSCLKCKQKKKPTCTCMFWNVTA